MFPFFNMFFYEPFESSDVLLLPHTAQLWSKIQLVGMLRGGEGLLKATPLVDLDDFIPLGGVHINGITLREIWGTNEFQVILNEMRHKHNLNEIRFWGFTLRHSKTD